MWIAWISPKSHNLGVKRGGMPSQICTRPWLKTKLGCGGHFRAHVPISTLYNHSSYYWWDTGRVELMQRPWINPNIHHLGLKRMRPWSSIAEIDTTRDSKVRVCWWLCMMNSNINHVQPFNIHIMRCWKCQAGVNCGVMSIWWDTATEFGRTLMWVFSAFFQFRQD